jgi:single-strand DNA-binding protein
MNTVNTVNTTAGELAGVPTNVVVLSGTVRSEPIGRALPSGSTVVQFDVATTVLDGTTSHSVSVPVAWADPSATSLASVTEGSNVVVIGTVRRRFFRVGGATQSRTEVVAESVLLARRRTQVAKVLTGVAERLVG